MATTKTTGDRYRSRRIATNFESVEPRKVGVSATAGDTVERSTTRKPSLTAKKSLAVSVRR